MNIIARDWNVLTSSEKLAALTTAAEKNAKKWEGREGGKNK